METSSLKTFKILPKNLNEIVCSWIWLLSLRKRLRDWNAYTYSDNGVVIAEYDVTHSKHIKSWSTTVYVLSSELGLSHPFLASECAPPPQAKGDGLGESQFWRLEKKLSNLPTLWLLLTAELPNIERLREWNKTCLEAFNHDNLKAIVVSVICYAQNKINWFC